jgi:hypothetical protein
MSNTKFNKNSMKNLDSEYNIEGYSKLYLQASNKPKTKVYKKK